MQSSSLWLAAEPVAGLAASGRQTPSKFSSQETVPEAVAQVGPHAHVGRFFLDPDQGGIIGIPTHRPIRALAGTG